MSVDVLVVGGGPAGSAAAIVARELGLSVRLLERQPFPRHRPGETLHPGVGSVLARLGVAERVDAASGLRHEAQRVAWGRGPELVPFGSDAGGRWRGYQVAREDLDAILLDRARELGAEVVQPAAAAEPLIEDGRVAGAVPGGRRDARARGGAPGHGRAAFTIDAAGGRGWLRRRLGLELRAASPPLRAYYGYCEAPPDPAGHDAPPTFAGDGSGWTWTARVAARRCHWTRLDLAGGARPDGPPPALTGLRQLGRMRGADVTWRHVPASAGPGYYLAGDAAAVLDPAASHGVLRALMSGMAAACGIAAVLRGATPEHAAAARYRDWIGSWFAHDMARLSDLYRQLDPAPGWLSAPTEGKTSWRAP